MSFFHPLFFLILIGVVAAACGTTPDQPYNYSLPLRVNDTELRVELADTPEKQQQGLSGRPPLNDAQGMLFDFRNTPNARPSFWMKDMKFALDLIWIKDNRIIEITPNVPPAPQTTEASLPTYSPTGDVDLVLEVLAGFTERHQIKIGDELKF